MSKTETGVVVYVLPHYEISVEYKPKLSTKENNEIDIYIIALSESMSQPWSPAKKLNAIPILRYLRLQSNHRKNVLLLQQNPVPSIPWQEREHRNHHHHHHHHFIRLLPTHGKHYHADVSNIPKTKKQIMMVMLSSRKNYDTTPSCPFTFCKKKRKSKIRKRKSQSKIVKASSSSFLF